jgi:hypothetical protein
MREVLQTGFIPFTFDAASSTPNGNNVSAEFACSDDGLNYDNWEFVRNPQAGSTYYCVAYNAPTVTPPGGGGGPGPNSDTDVCTNIDGIQATVPSGYVIGNTGLCEFVGGRGGGGLPTGGHGHSSSGGNNTPQGQVLGESTTTIPVGAPNTGAGGMSDLVTSLGALIALAGLALVAFATRKNA